MISKELYFSLILMFALFFSIVVFLYLAIQYNRDGEWGCAIVHLILALLMFALLIAPFIVAGV